MTLLIKQKQLKIVAKLGTSNSTVIKEVCSFRGCLRGRRQKNLEIVAIPHTEINRGSCGVDGQVYLINFEKNNSQQKSKTQ